MGRGTWFAGRDIKSTFDCNFQRSGSSVAHSKHRALTGSMRLAYMSFFVCVVLASCGSSQGTQIPLQSTQWVQLLRSKVQGSVYAPDTGSGQLFAAATHGYSQSPFAAATPPQAVLQPNGTQDIVAAITLARQYNLTVAVKGAGHWARQTFLAPGGLTIDMSSMHQVQVQPSALVAIVEGGARGREIFDAIRPYDLGMPWGDAAETGMGLALNGGIGMSMRAHGLVTDNIVGAEVVLANGSVINVDQGGANDDILRAMRGAGSIFGVVTQLRFRLFSNASSVYAGNLILKDDMNHSTFRAANQWAIEALDAAPGLGVETFILPGGVVLLQALFHGDQTQSEKAAIFDPIKQGPVIQDLLGKQDLYSIYDFTSNLIVGLAPYNLTSFWLSGLMNRTEAAGAGGEALMQAFEISPSPNGTVLLTDWFGTGTNNTQSFTAFNGAYMHFYYSIGIPSDLASPEVLAGVRLGADAMAALLAPHATILYAYPNLSTDPAYNAHLEQYVGGTAKLATLRQLKADLDPSNFFRYHHLTGLTPLPTATN